MRYFIIDQGFDQDLVKSFVSFVNENEGLITIYLDSNGGELPASQIIRDIINSEPERFTLIAVNAIRSSAFILFFSVKCKRRIFEDTTGLHHLMGRSARIMSNGVHSEEVERFEFKRLKDGHLAEVEFCESIGFSEKEAKSFGSGKDVFFTTKRLNELLALQNGI